MPPATDWIANKPTYELPIAPEMGKNATELYERTCYHANPYIKYEYNEDLDMSICRVNPVSTPMANGWTIHDLDEDSSYPDLVPGGAMP